VRKVTGGREEVIAEFLDWGRGLREGTGGGKVKREANGGRRQFQSQRLGGGGGMQKGCCVLIVTDEEVNLRRGL